MKSFRLTTNFMKTGPFLLFIQMLCAPFVFSVPPCHGVPQNLKDEDEINLYCLRKSYPQIDTIEKTPDGRQWLTLKDGQRVLYADSSSTRGVPAPDIRQSMSQIYMLEPERPETPSGYAPGRIRSYDLLGALYGRDAQAVQKGLVANRFQGKSIKLSGLAAAAFTRVAPRLELLATGDKRLKSLLKPDGGYIWRKIAGENAQSAHSYGIALDIGASVSPYWRWSSKRPHPMQKTYPQEIVRAFEDEGFIWGGKWHEYDLMHFEYRPELICKARIMLDARR